MVFFNQVLQVFIYVSFKYKTFFKYKPHGVECLPKEPKYNINLACNFAHTVKTPLKRKTNIFFYLKVVPPAKVFFFFFDFWLYYSLGEQGNLYKMKIQFQGTPSEKLFNFHEMTFLK